MEKLFTLDVDREYPLYGLHLKMDESALYAIKFIKMGDPLPPQVMDVPESDIYREVSDQLKDYFAGRLRTFSVPLEMRGTEFQKKIWALISEIPYGQTRTYKEIAEAAGSINLARAVGGAANRNPVPVIVPCHRVVGSSGALTGFAAGVNVKQFLLDVEQGYIS
ncbi:methylated-DNA--[protein]-cysteine S-methyltransferase [Desulfopila sp. IMCC35008]|uniref:methylated-DNA--[protein]-cysteine S-methyltransferase n=1 Tax=Desulfopila sp. IMCC35008 TaxID=2653858 RepID=UPI0013D7074B|nr:methylated-DNA--[protein]-cysteine S-methyltransferase [Desulfopila sp. IMCC35008]